jgi:hypothetical protein
MMSWPNRTARDVLEEMRKRNETRNYSYLHGLIEEMQSMANRMEAKLSDFRDIEDSHKQKREAEEEMKAVKEKLRRLKKELPIDSKTANED